MGVGTAKLGRGYIWAALSIVGGCYGPNADYVGAGASGSATGPGTTSTLASESSATSTTDPSETSDPSTSTTDPSETTGDPTETTGEPTETTGGPTCGDGNPDPGEFCFGSTNVSALGQVQSLAAGEFDGDDKLDLAIGRKDDVLVLFGDGLGGFPLESDLAEPNGNYWGVAAGDLNDDQLDDLVAANHDADGLLVFLSLGNGNFADPVVFPVGNQPTQLHLTQFDVDPFLDAVTAVRGSDAVAALSGDALGSLAAPVVFATGGDQPLALDLGDFNHDDHLDVAVANYGSDEIAMLLGTGAGQLAAPQLYLLGGKPRAVVVADFDLDAHLDVAAPLEDTDRVALLFGQGNGDLLEPAVEIAVGAKPVGAAAADLDNDTAPELLVMNFDDETVGVLFNDPNTPGQLAAHQTLVWFNDFTALAAMLVADFNADGVADLVVGGDGVRAMVSDP